VRAKGTTRVRTPAFRRVPRRWREARRNQLFGAPHLTHVSSIVASSGVRACAPVWVKGIWVPQVELDKLHSIPDWFGIALPGSTNGSGGAGGVIRKAANAAYVARGSLVTLGDWNPPWHELSPHFHFPAAVMFAKIWVDQLTAQALASVIERVLASSPAVAASAVVPASAGDSPTTDKVGWGSILPESPPGGP
jgi:hypothetical protein